MSSVTSECFEKRTSSPKHLLKKIALDDNKNLPGVILQLSEDFSKRNVF